MKLVVQSKMEFSTASYNKINTNFVLIRQYIFLIDLYYVLRYYFNTIF